LAALVMRSRACKTFLEGRSSPSVPVPVRLSQVGHLSTDSFLAVVLSPVISAYCVPWSACLYSVLLLLSLFSLGRWCCLLLCLLYIVMGSLYVHACVASYIFTILSFCLHACTLFFTSCTVHITYRDKESCRCLCAFSLRPSHKRLHFSGKGWFRNCACRELGDRAGRRCVLRRIRRGTERRMV
jgi:hypothetical protein